MKGLTFTHESEGNELGITQVNDLCGCHRQGTKDFKCA